jgi:AraC family transcriptional regulator, melibiose operon regulatory protein
MSSPVVNTFGFTVQARAPQPMTQAHRHSEIEVNFIQGGSLTYSFGGSRYAFDVGSVVCFWGAMPHQLVDTGADTRFICVTLPLALFLRWPLPAPFTARMLEGRPIGVGQASALDELLFVRWSGDLLADAAHFHVPVLLELEAWFQRAALTAWPPARPASQVSDAAERMARFIAAHYAEPIAAHDIARAASLHPNYAMQVFRRAYHMTMTDYLTQHRVAHAQRLLVLTDDAISSIALDAGFGSQSRFYEAFTRLVGAAPGAYRAAYR